MVSFMVVIALSLTVLFGGSCRAFSPAITNSGFIGSRGIDLNMNPSHYHHSPQYNDDQIASKPVISGPVPALLLAASIMLFPMASFGDDMSGATIVHVTDRQLAAPSSSLLVAAETSLDFSLPSSYDPKMSGFGEGKEAYLNSASNNESSSEKEKELIAMRKAEEARKEALAKKKAEMKAREEESKRRAELKKKENAERLKTIFS